MPFTNNVQTHTAVADGVNITYYDSDSAQSDKETIVLLHGTAGSAENNFWAIFPMLAMRHRVVALNFVDPETTVPEPDTYLRQVLAVVQACNGGKPVHILGYSFGAVIAALYAARNGDTVKSLTLVAGWVRTDNHQRLRNSVWRSLHESDHDAISAFSVFTNYSQSFLNARNDAEIAALIKGISQGADRSKKMAFNMNVDISQDLIDITCPTLVVACTLDITTPIRHSKMLFGGIADSRFVELNSGHGVVHERPAELFTMVDEFVRAPHAHPAGHIFVNAHA